MTRSKEPITDPYDEGQSEVTALTVFQSNTAVQKLPPAVQKMLSRFQLREAAGFAPQWKPAKVGDYLLGKILSVRGVDTQFGHATVVTMLCHDGQQRSIFLGKDLQMKLADASNGQVYVVTYEGVETKKDNPRLKNDMKKFSVVQVMPD